MKQGQIAALAIAAALSFGTAAEAAVIAGPTVGGIATFTDTNTGANWARLDTFFGKTHNQMAAAVTAAGFTVSDFATVDILLDSLALPDEATWDGYAAIMGQAPNRNLIWGSFGPVSQNNQVDWAFAFRGQNVWTAFNASVDADTVPNAGRNDADMNIWAYSGGRGVVPEPATWAMLITGFGLVGFAARRRAAATA